jgi:hypothetical protein
MLIRDIDRSLLPRTRSNKGRDANPLRKTAEGLGTFLDRLSESVRESRAAQNDSVDSGIRAHSRSPMRSFKWPAPAPAEEEGADSAAAAPAAPAVEFNLNEEQNEALGKLREARTIASDASSVAMSYQERVSLQKHMKDLFWEISAKRIDTLASMLDGTHDNNGDNSPFSIITPELARRSYTGIDGIISRFLEVETGSGINNAGGVRSEHEAALNATEQLREFLLNEGPARAFSRFREINRNNVLGLIQQ